MAFRLYTVREVADVCHMTVWGVRRWIKQGKLQAVKAPGKNLYLITDVDLTAWQIEHFRLSIPRRFRRKWRA